MLSRTKGREVYLACFRTVEINRTMPYLFFSLSLLIIAALNH